MNRSGLLACALLVLGGCESESSSQRDDDGSEPDAGAHEPPGMAGDDAGSTDVDAGDNADADAGSKDPGEEPQLGAMGKVKGHVTLAGGGPAVGLEVMVGAQKYKSDAFGAFEAKSVAPGKHQVRASSAETSAAQLEVSVQKDREMRLSLTVIPLTKKVVGDAALSFEVDDPASGVKVKVPAKGLVTKTGAEVKGSVTASYSLVKSQADTKALPGGLLAKIAGKDVELEAYGMIDLRFYQAEEEVSLASELELHVPLFANGFGDGEEVDAWTFDPVAGRWKTDGKATVHNSVGSPGYAVLKPKHLSWWGVALPFEASSCLSGRVASALGQGESYLSVHATGMDHYGSYATVTEEDGSFCLPVKAGGNVHVVASKLDAAGKEYRWQTSASVALEAALCGDASAGACIQVTWEAPSEPIVCADLVGHGTDHVYVTSSGDSVLDGLVLDNFATHGQAATLGVQFSELDGSQDLSAYDAIYLQANANWTAIDMPQAGQVRLADYVRCGGGLVTTEWFGWKIGTSSGFMTLSALSPSNASSFYTTTLEETYTLSEAHPTVQAGMPDSFTFALTSYSGTQRELAPKPGAREFYGSVGMSASGLVGWDYEQGRVASFSTTVGNAQVEDVNFSRLIANTLNWAQRE